MRVGLCLLHPQPMLLHPQPVLLHPQPVLLHPQSMLRSAVLSLRHLCTCPRLLAVCVHCAQQMQRLCAAQSGVSSRALAVRVQQSLPERFAHVQQCGGGWLLSRGPGVCPSAAALRWCHLLPNPPQVFAQLCAVPGAGQVISCCCAFHSESPSHSLSAWNATVRQTPASAQSPGPLRLLVPVSA